MKMSHRRKRQKTGESAKDPVEESKLKHIPADVWNEIFQYNTGKDLFNLSKVCKKFYETIGSSPEVMDNIVLVIRRETNAEEIINSPRNYTNIKIQYGSDYNTCLAILKKYGPKLRILTVNSIFVHPNLINILELVYNNLRSLSISFLNDIQRDQLPATEKVFTLMKLEKLELAMPSNIIMDVLLDFLPDTVLEFKYYSISIENGSLLKFLENQKKLKSLKLHLSQNLQLLNAIDVTKINFKLDNFEYCSMSSIPYVNEKFGKFLKSQAENLKSLKLDNIELQELDSAFEDMPKLEILEVKSRTEIIDQYERGPNFDCPALKKLIITFHESDRNLSSLKFLERFPNVEIVATILNCNPRFFTAFAKSHHPNLKKLVINTLRGDYFKSASYKSLSELIINGNCKEFNMEYAALAMENLKVLKIGPGVKVKLQNLMWILTNFKKLKHLEIRDGSKLSDNFLCRFSQYFKDLRVLKIGNLKKPLKGQTNNFKDCLAEFPNLKYSLSNLYEYHIDSSIDNYNDYNDSSDEETLD